MRETTNDFYSIEESNEDSDAVESVDQGYEPQHASLPSLHPENGLGESDNSNGEIDSESYEQSELSDPATVVTLYYPETEQRTFTSEFEDQRNATVNILSKTLRFTPASASMTKGHSRSNSAPPMHLSDFQAFKGSKEFLHLEIASNNSEELIYKDGGKLDLDSSEGHNMGKKFLDSVEVMMKSLSISCKDRKYREKFSQAYKVLYKENSLCYLTEILNSAQIGRAHV